MLKANTIISHYQVLRKLGAGGMGEVYLATDLQLQRTVALKILPADLAADSRRMRRFIQEAKSISALNHPNILTIHEIGQHEGMYFIATEFVDGETLKQRLRRSFLSLNETLDIAIQVASALVEAHDAGIIHRDIKPANIMIRRTDGIVKVLDFGLAKITVKSPSSASHSEAETAPLGITAWGVMMGTVFYMSPEQARGKAVDTQTDIWSFGVVVYEMLARKLPFEGETPNDYIASILRSEPLVLESPTTEIPPILVHLVHQALRKEKDARYQTMKSVLADLKSLRDGISFSEQLQSSAGSLRIPQRDDSASLFKAEVSGKVTREPPMSSLEDIAAKVKAYRRAWLPGFLALLLTGIIFAYWSYSRRLTSSELQAIESIAVLPFENRSSDADLEYLAGGISEALIYSLTELPQLKVIARSTAFRYEGQQVDPQTVGRELNVRAVLTGSVRQTGDTLNIKVDLVDTTTGTHLWAGDYERRAFDVLLVKQAIAREVTEKLRLRLSGEQQLQLKKHDTQDTEAYQFYLRGRFYWNKRTVEGLKKAIEEFQQAINRDPQYALGYVGLADSYLLLEYYTGIPASDGLSKARAMVDRALQLDDSLAEAHTTSAYIYDQQWRWAEAETEHRRAISLKPNYPTAHHWFANHLMTRWQFDEALTEIKRAQEQDPFSPIISATVAEVYLLKNDPDAAIEQCLKIIEMYPNYPGAREHLGFAYLKKRQYEQAIAEFQNAVNLSAKAGNYLGSLGYGYAVAGRRDESLAILEELEERDAKGEAIGRHLADIHVGLGNKNKALDYLERDFEQRSGVLQSIAASVVYEKLRREPGYFELFQRLGLNP